ncbi:sugar nucleotide-binding protein [Croceiramulus getboli]|nr:sugar nucleotide-binding protein [Flavobacteriaceae bacterium YJPT1-3]
MILGASGFLGGSLYKELYRFYDTHGTYHSGRIYDDNQHFHHYDMAEDDLRELLYQLKPQWIISALRGNFDAQIEAHQQLLDYALNESCKLIFLSSANVFDAFTNYPSYEMDKTLSESIYGKLKIRCENLLLRNLPEDRYVIARLPMVFGRNSPRLKEIKNLILTHEPVEVFPHLIINTTTDSKVSQQIHYIINRDLSGIFHLGSQDLIHHKELISELVGVMETGGTTAQYMNVYTSNFDRYLAVLPKDNKLPRHLQITNDEVVEASQIL